MKLKAWPRLEWKLKRKGISSGLLRETCTNLCNVIRDCSDETLSNKVNVPLEKLKEQVSEFLRRLRKDAVMCQVINDAIELRPLLDLVRECDTTIGDSYEEGFRCVEEDYGRMLVSCVSEDAKVTE